MFAQLFPLRPHPLPMPDDGAVGGLLGFFREQMAELQHSAAQARIGFIALLAMVAVIMLCVLWNTFNKK